MEIPCEELREVWYVGDGKHYLQVHPDRELLRPPPAEAELNQEENKGKWGEEIHIGEDTYTKISWKPGTRGHVCLFRQAFYDLTELCIGFTPAIWCGAPDQVQIRRWIKEIEKVLEVWKKDGKYLGIGVFDGGYLV